jgi:calcineurin-like phosphoesterase family protein
MSKIFFTSDHHFDHFNIIKHCNRPFTDCTEMNKALIKNWNETVDHQDEVYILGDFFHGTPQQMNYFFHQLSGKKYLIRGNHDKAVKNDGSFGHFKHTLQWIRDLHVLHLPDNIIVMCHYPLAEWPHYYRDAIHLYGHIHTNPPANKIHGKAINVCVDLWDYKPVSLEQITKKAGNLTNFRP